MNENELAELLGAERSPGASRPSEWFGGPGSGSSAGLAAERLRALLAEENTWVEPPAGGAESLLAAIRAEPEFKPEAVPKPQPELGGAVRPSAGAPAFRPVRSRPPQLRYLALAAAVVLLAGLVSVALLVSGGSDGGNGGETHELALVGTELAPEAVGTATIKDLPAGVAIVLDVDGLPPAPRGTYYQGWVRGPEGAVTVGTFHMRSEGGVELWAGVDLDRYPTLTVTLQEEGAGAESSGQVILTSDVGS